MVVSHKHEFIYFAPAKTATCSIRTVLESRFEGELYGDGSINLTPIHHMFLPKKWEHYFTFISVRNPYERFRSACDYFELQPEDLLAARSFRSITTLISQPHFAQEECVPLRIDAIVRAESLQRDFNRLPFVNKTVKVPVLNKSPKSTFISATLAEWIHHEYQQDFQMFGYDHEYEPDPSRLLIL